MRYLYIWPEGSGYICDEKAAPGTPNVGRGRTPEKALHQWLALNGIMVNVTPIEPHDIVVRT